MPPCVTYAWRANLGSFNNSFTTHVPLYGTVVLKVVSGTARSCPTGHHHSATFNPLTVTFYWGAMTNNKSIGGNAIKSTA